MPLRVQCSAGHLMMVPDHRAGTVLRCPSCGIDVQVPGEATGAAKGLGQPRLKPPIPGRMPAIPAISGAGEQSPQVAGHSTAAKSGIGQGGLLANGPRLRTPAPTKVQPKEELSPPIITPPPAPAEPRSTPVAPIAPVARDAGIQWTDEMAPATKPSAATPTQEVVFTDVDTQPISRRTTVEPSKPSKSRWQKEPAQPTPPPPSRPSSRPRSTLTGTILAPETPLAEPEPPTLVKPRASEPKSEPKPKSKPRPEPTPPPVVAKAEPELLPPPPIVEPDPEPPPIVAPEDSHITFHSAATQVEPHRPERPPKTPVPMVVTIGVRPTPAQKIVVWQLAAALLAAAILSIGPSLWEIGDFLGSDRGQAVSRWAYMLLMLGVVQLGCLFLLIQVPDWSTIWIVTIQSLVLAAIYAAVLGLTVITDGDSTLIDALQLGYQYNNGKAKGWCLCLAATYACMALFAGRFSAKWRKVLRQMQASDEAAYGL